jgi:hypothetical protein
MIRGTGPLGTREGSWCAVGVRLMLLVGAGLRGRRPRRFVMADFGYALVLVGGFVVLLLVLRGLQRL